MIVGKYNNRYVVKIFVIYKLDLINMVCGKIDFILDDI